MLKWKKLFVSLLSVSVIAGLGAAPVKGSTDCDTLHIQSDVISRK